MTGRFVYWMNVTVDLRIEQSAGEDGGGSWLRIGESLHREFGDRGFEVLAFPCNQFGAQEPGDAAEIANFCSLTYDVTFPVFAKIDVNGPQADPLFEELKAAAPGLLGSKAIKWNFTKFLVDREGRVVSRYAPTTKPEDIRKDIEKLL